MSSYYKEAAIQIESVAFGHSLAQRRYMHDMRCIGLGGQAVVSSGNQNFAPHQVWGKILADVDGWIVQPIKYNKDPTKALVTPLVLGCRGLIGGKGYRLNR